MLASFDVCICYGQVFVSHADAVMAPIWTDAHCAQGFAWLPKHVSFGVPDHDGLCRVEVAMGSAADVTEPLWAVRVPFDLAEDARVTIGAVVGEEREVTISAGRYGVIFAAYPGAVLGPDYAFRLSILFGKNAGDGFAILHAGDELTTDVVLRTDAEPI